MAAADRARDSGSIKSAATLYEEISDRFPEFFPAWLQLGNMRKDLGAYDAAESAYSRALLIAPRDIAVHVQLSQLFDLRGRPDLAAAWHDEALRLKAGPVRKGEFGQLSIRLSRIALTANSTGVVTAAANPLTDPAIAYALAAAIIRGLMRREPDQEGVQAYGTALMHGHDLGAIVRELVESPEYKSTAGRVSALRTRPATIAFDIAHLAQSLIVEQLTVRGCTVPDPPFALATTHPVDEMQMHSLLHTLAMIGDDRSSLLA